MTNANGQTFTLTHFGGSETLDLVWSNAQGFHVDIPVQTDPQQRDVVNLTSLIAVNPEGTKRPLIEQQTSLIERSLVGAYRAYGRELVLE